MIIPTRHRPARAASAVQAAALIRNVAEAARLRAALTEVVDAVALVDAQTVATAALAINYAAEE